MRGTKRYSWMVRSCVVAEGGGTWGHHMSRQRRRPWRPRYRRAFHGPSHGCGHMRCWPLRAHCSCPASAHACPSSALLHTNDMLGFAAQLTPKSSKVQELLVSPIGTVIECHHHHLKSRCGAKQVRHKNKITTCSLERTGGVYKASSKLRSVL